MKLLSILLLILLFTGCSIQPLTTRQVQTRIDICNSRNQDAVVTIETVGNNPYAVVQVDCESPMKIPPLQSVK